MTGRRGLGRGYAGVTGGWNAAPGCGAASSVCSSHRFERPAVPVTRRGDGSAFAGTLPWLLMAALAIAGCAIAALASWIGALLNTYRLDDKTWFVALLVLGVFSLGWVAMVAYVVAGPDGTTREVSDPGVAMAGEG